MLNSDTAAIIDVGSNAVRLFVARLRGQSCDILSDQREPIRLGSDSFHRGSIQANNFKRLAECIWSYRLKAHRLGAIHLRAVATSAIRDARNSTQLIDYIWARTGVKIEVIDGETEARLLHRAITSSSTLRSGSHLLADLGGGSLELVTCDHKDIRALWSLAIGTVRLLKRVGRDKPYEAYARAIHPHLGRLAEHPHFVRDVIHARRMIGTGGNFRALLRLFHSFHFDAPQDQLSIDDLGVVSDTLFRLNYRDRIDLLRMKPDRADVIRPATVIILEIMRHFGFAQVTVPNIGIKNGLFWELADRLNQASLNRNSVIRSTKRLGFSTLQQ